jgi:hypothetical protein
VVVVVVIIEEVVLEGMEITEELDWGNYDGGRNNN